jgi:hypothetical protein
MRRPCSPCLKVDECARKKPHGSKSHEAYSVFSRAVPPQGLLKYQTSVARVQQQGNGTQVLQARRECNDSGLQKRIDAWIAEEKKKLERHKNST